ncbi:MAG: hypothetical protein FWG04_02625 [Desulfovibrionaceae bacterium]|nr:hypothetical protein [Desulfovibrionaceae bacterium]
MDDLLDIITDPDLGGCAFEYSRITESVNEKGRAVQAEQIFPAQGNIQPAPGKEREVLEDADRLKATILIFTPAPLTAGDRVYHEGGVYRAALAEPWRQHAGFTKAIAVLESQ